ncbi:ribosome-associated translation inhibitor RaiA [Alginatibacterium sediminis]|uniref:Ribosome-associated translation inhibitor RaiA n=1 Tax=Alginatibacterium sediminis TaxID=2164068 RepID=A0A420ED21_9ALTE|nr:ribosome-associated translation inhibitor RaiA [Alginatibacterium sediminis]RKF18629.1 ribosome-associated translation inhibitor RaiA [Alginatibacterium sediminis]
MQIDIASKTVTISEHLREDIRQRYSKLAKSHVPLISPQFIITTVTDKVKIEAKIGIPNGQLFASDAHQDIGPAVNALFHKLERQLLKHQQRSNDHRANRDLKQMTPELEPDIA